jgi:hypothetical protein
MHKANKKELSDLYPKPKTYDQLKAEREQAQLAHQPRFVAPKIALWSTFGLATVLAAYDFITHIINDIYRRPAPSFQAPPFRSSYVSRAWPYSFTSIRS